MKKNIQDYSRTNTKIHVTSEEEYRKLVPLLNTIFHGWNPDNWERYASDDLYYIDLSNDSIRKEPGDSTIFLASDFIDDTINSYEIY